MEDSAIPSIGTLGQVKHFHVRVTPATLEYDLSGWFVDDVSRYVIAKELGKVTFKPHYHIYAELKTDVCEKTLRNRATKAFGIKAGKRGQVNKDYCLKYCAYKTPSPAYLLKDVSEDMEPFDSRGYTQAEIEFHMSEGKRLFKRPRHVPAPQAPQEAPAPTPKEEKMDEWKKLLVAFDDYWYEDESHRRYNMAQIESWIKSYYLSRSRPIPRAGDSRRYAYSLWAIMNEKVEYRDIATADAHEKNIFT